MIDGHRFEVTLFFFSFSCLVVACSYSNSTQIPIFVTTRLFLDIVLDSRTYQFGASILVWLLALIWEMICITEGSGCDTFLNPSLHGYHRVQWKRTLWLLWTSSLRLPHHGDQFFLIYMESHFKYRPFCKRRTILIGYGMQSKAWKKGRRTKNSKVNNYRIHLRAVC